MDYKKNRQNGFGRIGLILGLPFILLVAAFLVYKMFLISDPVVTGLEALELLSADKTVSLHGENIKEIVITAYQGGKTIELLRDSPEYTEQTYTLEIKPKELKLEDGPAVISIEANAGLLKEISHVLSVTIDTVPPVLRVLKAPSLINQGSSGVAVLKAKGADSVYIKLGDRSFPAFEVELQEDIEEPAGEQNRAGVERMATYYVFFPAPFDIEAGSTFYAIAEDTAGNRNVNALSTRLQMKEYKVSTITIDDTFINQVISPLLNVTEISDPVGAFRTVNEDWRIASQNKIFDIARATEPDIMWEGRFLQLKNSKVMATYGDQREYVYDGEIVSKSVHLGYDLASHANAPFGAANTGVVKYAGDLNIYGSTVILDHGYGLMTIYGHLSEIFVEEGDVVQKGDIMGKTGSSGLAGGDHLHFGVLVHGYEVSPLYWWDAQWIKVNIATYLIH